MYGRQQHNRVQLVPLVLSLLLPRMPAEHGTGQQMSMAAKTTIRSALRGAEEEEVEELEERRAMVVSSLCTWSILLRLQQPRAVSSKVEAHMYANGNGTNGVVLYWY